MACANTRCSLLRYCYAMMGYHILSVVKKQQQNDVKSYVLFYWPRLSSPTLSHDCGNGRSVAYMARCEVTRCRSGCWNVRHVSAVHATYVERVASCLCSFRAVGSCSGLSDDDVDAVRAIGNFLDRPRYNLRSDHPAGTVASNF